ncbi:N-terminal EF-hand calcium-binding protein 1-like isoform X1 [Myxocyprinus asiaticus]|uniref:N-terminal EF-hand calcium-binding protein 1-like isoform X1 n=1 Tax=Myxocyprinus asiaticus TaxID=70543 RepID=UPI0022233C2F|nr:N-terminal EF-hand calcium-binding protein 1-like isoform X1 [Myxocyprinus asiaticus]
MRSCVADLGFTILNKNSSQGINMDCSEEVQSLSDEASTPMELKKGMSIFLDILRRADKNDDGKLSFDEFKAYFSDGVLSGDELKELFHTIDTHNTDNVDTDELCEYFSQHLGEYENVLAALEDLNVSILKAMDKTKKEYQESTHLEQFVTRFLLKETTSQLQSLQSSLECAMETTAEQTRQERKGPVKPEVLSIQLSGRRSNRRLQRNNSLSPNNPLINLVNSGLYEEDNQWMTQINRLQKLIDRLEKKATGYTHDFTFSELRLEPVEEEVLESTTKSHILIVQRQLSVLEEEVEEFRLALRQYIDCASVQTGCLHVAVQRLANESRFILYEFWEQSNVWKNHLQTNYSKTFQRGNVDFLETPEIMTTMLVPASWWVLNNN